LNADRTPQLKAVVMRLHDSMIVNWPKLVSALGAFLGLIILLAGVYVFANRVLFLAGASSSSAPIVAVAHEYVPAGRGSVLAYVPTVELPDGQGRVRDVKVDTSNEAPVYTIGQQLQVSCNPERGCIEDTFFAKWGVCLIELLISLIFFSPLLAWKVGLWQPNGKITGLDLQRRITKAGS
jgi:hypothetical protein